MSKHLNSVIIAQCVISLLTNSLIKHLCRRMCDSRKKILKRKELKLKSWETESSIILLPAIKSRNGNGTVRVQISRNSYFPTSKIAIYMNLSQVRFSR